MNDLIVWLVGLPTAFALLAALSGWVDGVIVASAFAIAGGLCTLLIMVEKEYRDDR